MRFLESHQLVACESAGRILAVVLAAGLAACNLYRPDADLDRAASVLPQSYPETATGAEPGAAYWQAFGTPELERLVAAAIANNRELAAARQRLQAAGFGAWQAWSGRMPELRYDASVARTDTQSAAIQQDRADGWTWQLGVAGSYEVDLWGQDRARHMAREADLRRSRWQARTAEMTVAAETVLRWIDVVASRAQLDLLDSQIAAVSAATGLLEQRYRQGDADWTDVLGQREIRYRLEEERAGVRARRDEAAGELRLLLGGGPVSAAVTTAALPAPAELPGTGVPADLVTRRPDVRAAWESFVAATWETSVAQAERLPSLTLSGTFSYAAATPQSLFDTWVSSLVGGIAGPLLDFRGRKFAAEEAAAEARARLEELRQSLLAAYRDVEVALSAYRHLEDRRRALARRVEINRDRSQRLRRRYLQGAAPYMDVHQADLDRLQAEQAAIALAADQLAQRVQLARALGGGWRPATAPTNDDPTEGS